MTPLVAIVGRPNVGKSTLFNRLVGRSRAIVHKSPGVTRDLLYEEVVHEGRRFLVVDTGGYDEDREDSLEEALLGKMRSLIAVAVEQADAVLFLMDGQVGVAPLDAEIGQILRTSMKPVFHVINKIDGPKHDHGVADFYRLGPETVHPISAAHGRGIGDLLDALVETLPQVEEESVDPEETRIAVVGRPNVGKSTLVNSLLGYQRVMVDDKPGTTRDAIDTPFSLYGKRYRLIDTAGIRRKGRVRQELEKYTVIMALKSLQRCDVALVLFDASEGVTAQDAHIAGYALDRGRGCILVVNKYDLARREGKKIADLHEGVRWGIKHLAYAPVVVASARTGEAVDTLLPLIDEVAAEFWKRVPTPALNRLLKDLQQDHGAPQVRGRPLRFYYIRQVSAGPPTFAIVANEPRSVHFSYQRYIVNRIRDTFGFRGVPVRLVFEEREGRKPARKKPRNPPRTRRT